MSGNYKFVVKRIRGVYKGVWGQRVMSRELLYHGLTKNECLFVVKNFEGRITLWNHDVDEKETYLSIGTKILHPLDGEVSFRFFTDKKHCDHDFCLEVANFIETEYGLEGIEKVSNNWTVRTARTS